VVRLWCFVWLEMRFARSPKMCQVLKIIWDEWLRLQTRLPDGRHGGAEKSLEVLGGLGGLLDRGFDRLLGDRARIAEVDEGGEGVVAGGAVVGSGGGGGGDGYGEVVELVFEFEDDALGGLLADAGDAGEGGVIAGADGGDEAAGVDAAENGDGELGADAGDGEEFFEEAFLLGLGESEEGDLVFADVGVDVQCCFDAFAWECGEGGYADGDVVAYAGALDDGLIRSFGEETSAEMSDHAGLIVAWCESGNERSHSLLSEPGERMRSFRW
jgi:hypothetical protein